MMRGHTMEDKNDFLKVDEKQGKKKSLSVIVVILAVLIVLLAIVLTAVLVKTLFSMGTNDEDTTLYELTTNNKVVSTTDDAYLKDILGVDDTQSDESNSGENDVSSDTIANIITDTTKHALIESYEHLSVNGENLLSDHYDNEFIQLVSNKYGVDTDLLVAIYSVPDSGTNFVLQFNGDKRRSEYVKSPDTLEKVYQIDMDRNIKVATGTPSGNEGVSYPESVMCVAMVKKIVMEQYPNYFTGLEQ